MDLFTSLFRKKKLPPAIQKLYWLLLFAQRILTMEGGGFFGVAGANWGRLGAPQQRLPLSADRPSPDSTHPKCSAYFNVTSTSLRSSTVEHTDLRTSWAPRRTAQKSLHRRPNSRSLHYPPQYPIGSGRHHPQHSHKITSPIRLVSFTLRGLRNLPPSSSECLQHSGPPLNCSDHHHHCIANLRVSTSTNYWLYFRTKKGRQVRWK